MIGKGPGSSMQNVSKAFESCQVCRVPYLRMRRLILLSRSIVYYASPEKCMQRVGIKTGHRGDYPGFGVDEVGTEGQGASASGHSDHSVPFQWLFAPTFLLFARDEYVCGSGKLSAFGLVLDERLVCSHSSKPEFHTSSAWIRLRARSMESSDPEGRAVAGT
jgi:hypothetical protein